MKKKNTNKYKLPKYPNGGNFWKDTGDFLGNMGKADANAIGAVVGYTPFNDSQFTGTGSEFGKTASHIGSQINRTGSQMAANMFLPGSGAILGQVQNQVSNATQDPNQPQGQQGQQMGQMINTGMQMANMANSMFRSGGIQNFYPEGGSANSQIEKEENFITPQGEFGQANGPSHEEGGVDLNLPQNTIIFSDKLRPKGFKKTYAQLNKVNNTTKEDEILEDKNSTSESKKSANLMLAIKKANSQRLFQDQEQSKQARLTSYMKRLGGVQMFPGGGITGPQYYTGQPGYALSPRGGNEYYNTKDYSYDKDTDKFTGLTPNANVDAGGNPIASAFLKPQMQQGTYRPMIDPNHKPMQFGPNMNYNPNTNQYIDTTGKPVQPINSNFRTGGIIPKYTYGSPGTQPAGFIDENPSGYAEYNADPNSVYNYRPNSFMGEAYRNPGNQIPGNNVQYQTNQPIVQPKGNPVRYQDNTEDPYRFGNYSQKDLSSIGSNQSNNGFNPNKDALYQTAGTLAQSAGQLAYLHNQGKKYDTQQFYNYNPQKLDPTAALRDADLQANAANNSLQNGSGGSGGNYMANRVALSGSNTMNKAAIRNQYDNQNAQINNGGQEFNIRNRYMTDDINARNKGAALSNYYNTVGSLGTNAASGMRDYRADQYDQQRMNYLPYMYNNPEFNGITQAQGYSNRPGMKPKFDPYTGKPL